MGTAQLNFFPFPLIIHFQNFVINFVLFWGNESEGGKAKAVVVVVLLLR